MNRTGSHPWVVCANAVTPLGYDLPSTATAVRAQMSSFRETYMVDRAGEPIVASIVEGLKEDCIGPERVVDLALAALQPVMADISEKGVEVGSFPIFLSLPMTRPGTEILEDVMYVALASVFGGEGARDYLRIRSEGHASTIRCLEDAVGILAKGEAELCLIGGVDSYWQYEVLDCLDQIRRLRSDRNLDGFIPGEAAAFVLLMTPHYAQRLGMNPMAELGVVANAHEPQPLNVDGVSIGEGLSSALRSIVSSNDLHPAMIDWVVCDMNGESYRSMEWSYAWLRTGKHFRDPVELWHPADCYGDVGSASGALLLAITAEALDKGYGRGQTALVFTSSDGPLRSAAVLRGVA